MEQRSYRKQKQPNGTGEGDKGEQGDIIGDEHTGKKAEKSEARKGTMAYGIMEAHNTSGNMESTAESG